MFPKTASRPPDAVSAGGGAAGFLMSSITILRSTSTPSEAPGADAGADSSSLNRLSNSTALALSSK